MLRYYKNLVFFLKSNYEHDDQSGSSGFYHSKNNFESNKDTEKVDKKVDIVIDNEVTTNIVKESNLVIPTDWKKTEIFAGKELSGGIKQRDYDVFIRENGNNVDLKIERGFFRYPVIIKGVPRGSEQLAIDKLLKHDLSAISNKDLILGDTKSSLETHKVQVESNEPLDIKDLDQQISFFDNMLSDSYLSSSEIKSINYQKIQRIIIQSATIGQERNESFLNKIDDLNISIKNVINEYHKRIKNNDPDFKSDKKFEEFIKFNENVTNSLVKNGLEFKNLVDKMSLAELLSNYKKLQKDDGKRYLILQKIVDKHINAKGNHLAYGEKGEIIIKSNNAEEVANSKNIIQEDDNVVIQPKPLEPIPNIVTTKNKGITLLKTNDEDSNSIINTVSQDDLKGELLRDVISTSGFDENKEKPDYKTLIPKILEKNNIKDDNGGVFVYQDIITRKKDIVDAINLKLMNNNNINESKELNFVLDYIENKKLYPVEVIQKATEMSVLRKSGYDPTTIEGKERLEKAFKEKNGVNTIINDIMGANGGMVGAAIIIGCIIGLFKPGKWRNASLSILGILILGPAAEQLVHKWGLAEYITNDMDGQKIGKDGKILAGLENQFKGVDVTIKNLPPKYHDKYNDMYENNIKGDQDKMLFPQDFAQIFSGFVQKKEVRKIKINDLEVGLKNGTDWKGILGEDNIPKKYIKEILESDSKDKIIDERNITDSQIKRFLEILISKKEAGDNSLGDLFVSGQEKPTEYFEKEKFNSENDTISKEMDKISFSSPVRAELEKILGRTNEIFSIQNTVAKFDNSKRKEQINTIIVDLKALKTKDSSLTANIDVIIGEYEKVLKTIDLGVKIDEFKGKALTDGELFPGMTTGKELFNSGVEGIAGIVGILKIKPGFKFPKFDSLNTDNIDKIIKEGELFLSSPGSTDEQKKSINETIIKLKDKKLKFLEAKDLTIPNSNGVMSDDTKKALASSIESNNEEITKQLIKITLETKPNNETLLDYSGLLVKNYDNLIFLQRIVDIDDTMLGSKGKIIKDKADELLQSYNTNNGFESNLTIYLETKHKEIDDINSDIKSADISSIKTILEDLKNLKDEFIKEGLLHKSLNYLGDKFGIDSIKSSGNSILDFQDYYNKLLKKNVDFEGEDFIDKLDEVEQSISKKLIELINAEKLPDLPSNISKQTELDKFIIDINAYKTKIEPFKDIKEDLVQIKGKVINIFIIKIEGLFLEELSKSTDPSIISKLSTKWESFKKELKYDGKVFNEAYEKKMNEIADKEFINGLSNITLNQAPEQVGNEFNELMTKYKGADGGYLDQFFKPNPINMKELLEKLIQARDDATNFIKTNPDNKKIKQKITDINFTINQIKEILKGNILSAELKGYLKITAETIGDYFKTT